MQQDCHRNWIWQRDAMLSSLRVIGSSCRTVAADRELCKRCLQGEYSSDILCIDHGLFARNLPANHLDRQARQKDYACRFGIDPDIELRCGSYISLATWCTSHNHAATDISRDPRLAS